ncbi:MAG: O-antigen ligase family protein [Patescibacteria group bacterium]|jgi:O-antigen ligase
MILKTLFLALICSFGLGQISSLVSIGEAKIYAFDPLVAVFDLVSIFYLLLVKKRFVISKFFLPLLVFAFIAFVSLLVGSARLSETEVLVSAMYPIRFFAYLVLGIVVHNLMETKIFDTRFLKKAVFVGALLVSVLGFVQLVVLPDFTTLDSELGWDPHKNRLASAFFDPNFTGGFLFTSMFLILWLEKKFTPKLLVLLLAIFLTFSRSTWGALAAAVLLLGAVKYRKLLLLSALLAFLAYFAVPRVQTRISGITDPADSAAFRLISWGNVLTIARENPLFGVGFNSYRYAQIERGFVGIGEYETHSGSGSDSSFLLVLATTGVIGFIPFVVGYFWPLFSAMKRKDFFFASILVGLFLHTQFVNALFYPQIMFLWMLLLGVYSALFSYRKV